MVIAGALFAPAQDAPRERKVLTGTLQADPSTVNNDPYHFDMAAFRSGWQQPGAGATKGWWNIEPGGDRYVLNGSKFWRQAFGVMTCMSIWGVPELEHLGLSLMSHIWRSSVAIRS